MATENLPLYRIHDFKTSQAPAPYFYISPFSEHIRRHAFIQKPHKHDFYILLLITKGSGTHTIDFKTHPVRPYTVFCLSPGQVHSWQLSEDAEGFILFFSPGYYLLRYPQSKLYSFPFFNPLLHSPCIQLSAAEAMALLNPIKSIEAEFNRQQIRKDDVTCAYLHIFFIYLSRLYQSHQPHSPLPLSGLSLLQRLEILIEQHYKEHKPVSFYAEQLHLTLKTLNDASRQIGKTISELIRDRVLLEAKRLLVHSPDTVTRIAAELGYYDNSYFNRFFKKHTGTTPEQFRKEHL